MSSNPTLDLMFLLTLCLCPLMFASDANRQRSKVSASSDKEIRALQVRTQAPRPTYMHVAEPNPGTGSIHLLPPRAGGKLIAATSDGLILLLEC
jgi:hypothetical protein